MMSARRVAGTYRDDPFLVLDEPGLAMRDACIAEAVRLHRQAHDARDWTALGQFLDPAVGDLVLELTRASWARDQRLRTIGFGYLVGRDGETWYVQYGPEPDDICDWDNCMFIRVPAAAADVRTGHPHRRLPGLA
jgi:hypothetical protein